MATIDYAAKYSQVIDERFAHESRSARLVNQDYEWTGVKSIKVYSISTSDMNDYTRSGADRYGTPAELDATTQEMIVTQDKSFTFVIDKMDGEETGGALNAGRALARQIRERVIPMVDTYRYTKMSAGAGTKPAAAAITAENVYSMVLDATATLDEKAVPVTGRFLVVTPLVYKAMKESKDIVLDTEIGQDMRLRGVIAMLDNYEVVRIPASMLPSKFGMLAGHSIATVAPVKLVEYKVHTDPPGISGDLVEGRLVFDAFVLGNKDDALYYQAIV